MSKNTTPYSSVPPRGQNTGPSTGHPSRGAAPQAPSRAAYPSAPSRMASAPRTGNQTTQRPPSATAQNRKAAKRRHNAKRTALFASLGVFAVLMALLVYSVVGYSRVYPNVTVDGQNVGGYTREQVVDLLAQNTVAQFAGKELVLQSGDQRIVFDSEDFAHIMQRGSIADDVYNFGREGGFFQRLGDVISSPFSTHSYTSPSEFYIDREVIDTKIAELAKLLDDEPIASTSAVTDEGITVVKGKPGARVEQDALATLIISRFQEEDFSPMSYEPTVLPLASVDFAGLYETTFREMKNATCVRKDNGDLDFVEAVSGISFNVEEARAAVNAAAVGETVEIPFVFEEPKVSKADLQDRLFSDTLSSFTTYLNTGNKPRTGNITKAAGFINETILLPGEVFSYNGIVGERTSARGFQAAGAYVNGRLVDEVGGGICQMSTTVYCAAMRANLKIVERSNHSMTVGYVSAGQDATVNWGTTDFKFENDTLYPIKVMASREGGSLSVSIIGTKTDDYTVTVVSDVLSTTPFETKVTINPNLAPGARKVIMEGHNGMVAETYRVIKDKDGNTISRNFEAKSVYKKTDLQIEEGPAATPAATPDTTPPPTNPDATAQ